MHKYAVCSSIKYVIQNTNILIKDGFTGSQCQTQNINVCQSSPCLNGGTCSSISTTQYSCSCSLGYQGSMCQLCSLKIKISMYNII